ncbi:MAG: MFS transporter [Pseudobutyrivibrio sp.]|nr:MFS transporter [Pseudobutyrivibrio sp.]
MNKTKIKVGVLSICAVALSYMALSPIIASIAADFPGVNETLPQMVFTLPSFMFIGCSPLCGIAMSHINKKTIAIGGLLCYLIGGLLPFFFNSSIWELLAGSAIIGIGTGFLMPLINGFIVQYFKKDEQAGLMGLNATFTAVGALSFIFIGGQLAKMGWRYSYLTFLLVIPIILIALICLPKGEPQVAEVADKDDSVAKSQFEMNSYILGLFVIGTIYFIMQNAFNTNSSAYVAEVLGAGTGIASLVTMANTLGGILGGTMFRGLVMKFNSHIETVTLAAIGIGFLIPVFIPHMVALIIGSIMVGYGYAIFNAGGTYLLAQNTRPETNAFTVSVYLAVINLGAAFSPIIVNAFAGIIGNGATIKFLLAGVVIIAVAVYSFMLNFRRKYHF